MKVQLKSGKIIRLGTHGIERLKERIDVNEFYKQLVKDAYENGEELDDKEREAIFTKGLYYDKYWDSVYKKYKNDIYIFRNRKASIIFITVLNNRE